MRRDKKSLNDTQLYGLLGALFGLAFPILATIVRIASSGESFNLSNIIAVHADPLLWIIDTAPFVLGFIATIAGRRQNQLRVAITQLRQRENELVEERDNLEKHVEERTVRLLKKTDQLRSASYIARQTAEIQDLGAILNNVVSLVTDQFGFYHTGIFLINETGDEVVLQATSSEGGKQMMEKGHSLAVGTQGIVGYVAAQKKSRIALDVGNDAVFFNNPYLPMTRSEVAIPLLIRNRILGVLDIQSDKPQAFTIEDIDVLETLADQVAIAIENARLLDESQATLLQLEAVTAVRTREAWSQKLQEREHVYTYTPLGLRAGKSTETGEATSIVPINLRGQKIGNISIMRKGNPGFNKVDEDLISEVATQVGLALENIRLLEEATQRARQEQTVGELAARFSQSLDIDSLLQTAARELGQIADVSEVSVFISQTEDDHKIQPSRMKRRVG
jgi:GAF domain-containing protein